MVVVGGIYSLQPLPSRWVTLLSMGTSDSTMVHQTLYCSLYSECHISRPLGFGAVDYRSILSSCGTGQSGAFWLCRLALTSDSQIVLQSTIGEVDRCSVGSPDSPMNYSRLTMRKPKSGQFVRCFGLGTGQCLVRHWLHQYLYAPNFVEFLNSFLLYVNVNIIHLIKTFTRQTS
jgi:hypothetical protein